MPRRRTLENRIRAAAVNFACGERDAPRLSELVGVAVRTLYRVAGDENHELYPVFYAELKTMGIEDEPVNFRVKRRGRQVDEKKRDAVRTAWAEMGSERRAGFSRRELAHRLADEVDASPVTVTAWLKKFETAEREELMSSLYTALQDAFAKAGISERFARVWTAIASGGYQKTDFHSLALRLEQMRDGDAIRNMLAKTFYLEEDPPDENRTADF